MIPKNHKIFKDGIANEVGVHENVVDDFISFYYSNVRSALSSLEHNKIFVDGLGTFTLRKARLEKAIVKNKSYLGNLEKNTYKGYDKSISVIERINKLENALHLIEESIEKKKIFKSKKNGTS
jgi:nucleoid DNA-binding protein